MAKEEVASHGMEEHNATWEGFVKGSVALSLMSAYIVVALCLFGFGTSYTFLVGFGGMIVGLIAIIIDARANPSKWYLSTGLLIAYGLLVAAMIT
ncbi:hypothetical protein MNBD_ALPHA08-1982 [hydrothermal vent metagenome]|uniref:Uncharacterized protein n=2 Tax=hydrothermal vent metagenome TaxID=652676 RepID=A0A3B0RJK5_9ZZZZ